jgi:hypothetical protein
MNKQAVSLNLQPIGTGAVTVCTAPIQIIHVRPDNPDAHKCDCQDHPMLAMLKNAGVQIPGMPEFNNDAPKFHPKGGVTIGYQIDDGNKMINVAFAKCKDEESYSTKLGVKLVNERISQADPKFTFSLSFDNVLEFNLAAMQELKGLKRSFVGTITFDHLSKDAVQYAIGQGLARRLKVLKDADDKRVNEMRQEKAKKKHLNKIGAKVLAELPPPPPDMPLH